MPRRNVTESRGIPADAPAPIPTEERYRIFRLCACSECGGRGKIWKPPYATPGELVRCPECRGEGRVRQEVATCGTPAALGVALVTLGREGEFEDCPVGVLDSLGAPGEKWIVRPWERSPRNVSDAARLLQSSRRR